MPVSPLDHDADLGFEVDAATEADALAEAVAGLTACLTDPGTVRAVETRRVEAFGATPPERLVRWLKEWHSLYEREGFLAARVRVTALGEGRIAGEGAGERRDPARHRAIREVKAVTYHQAALEPRGGRWYGRVVFDV